MSDNDANHAVQADNERARITRWHLRAGGGETGHHRHDYDYAIVPVTDGVLTIVDNEGVKQFPLAAGESYFRRSGVEHNVKNDTEQDIIFVEVEIK